MYEADLATQSAKAVQEAVIVDDTAPAASKQVSQRLRMHSIACTRASPITRASKTLARGECR